MLILSGALSRSDGHRMCADVRNQIRTTPLQAQIRSSKQEGGGYTHTHTHTHMRTGGRVGRGGFTFPIHGADIPPAPLIHMWSHIQYKIENIYIYKKKERERERDREISLPLPCLLPLLPPSPRLSLSNQRCMQIRRVLMHIYSVSLPSCLAPIKLIQSALARLIIGQ